MSFSGLDAMLDAAEQIDGREIDLGCPDCGEAWAVTVYEGEELTDDQLACPAEDCDGEGREI